MLVAAECGIKEFFTLNQLLGFSQLLHQYAQIYAQVLCIFLCKFMH